MASCFQCGRALAESQVYVQGNGVSAFTFCAHCAPADATPPTATATANPTTPMTAPAPTATNRPTPTGTMAPSAGIAAGTTAPSAPVPRIRRADHIRDNGEPNMLVAAIVGFLAMALASAIWYGIVVATGWMIGYVAIGIGFIIAFGVVIGSGGNHGPKLQILSVGYVLISMYLSTYFIIRHYAVKELGPLPLFVDPVSMTSAVVEFFKADPLSLLFWGIAIFEAIKIPSESNAQGGD